MKDKVMRSYLVLGAVKMQNIDQVLDLSSCSAPFTDIFIQCVSDHEKAAESQNGDDRVDAVALHSYLKIRNFLGVKAREHSALWVLTAIIILAQSIIK